jgi:hypothetical protein
VVTARPARGASDAIVSVGSMPATMRPLRTAKRSRQYSSYWSVSSASQGIAPGPSARVRTRVSSTHSPGAPARQVAVASTESRRFVSPSAGRGTAAASKWTDSRSLTIHQWATGTPSRSKQTGEVRTAPGPERRRHSSAASPPPTTLPGPIWNARWAPGMPTAAIERA